MMKRREFMAASAAALAAPAPARAESSRVLRYVPAYDPMALDPVWSRIYATRDAAYLVFDTLFGVDTQQNPSPQMLEGVLTEDQGRRWTLTLRPGLQFHDREPVLARDCVASLNRWATRDSFGTTLMAATDELSAADDRKIVFRLKRPFPLLPYALGKATLPPVIMPERLAKTSAFTRVAEIIGSGPFRYKPDERIAGIQTVFERFAGYRPREAGTPNCTAGPKIAHFDRVIWTVLPDPPTAVGALETGEQDWWERVPSVFLPSLRRNREIALSVIVPSGDFMLFRMNHTQPPFDNPAMRRALLGGIDQSEIVAAMVAGEKSLGRAGVGFFCPFSPMASSAGMEVLTGPRDLAKVRRQIAEAGYEGEKVVALGMGDNADALHYTEIVVEVMRKVGMTVDLQVSDAGTMFQRLYAKRGPVEQGGWSCTAFTPFGTDVWDPVVDQLLWGNGPTAPEGWPKSRKLEEMRDAWMAAPDFATRKEIARKMQLQAFQDLPYIPLGTYLFESAHRKDLTGILQGFPIFWNVRRS